MLLLSDVARELKVKPYQIVYLITTGKIPDVSRVGNRRMFSKNDVDQIRKIFNEKGVK
jgi:DNA-binding transcriptional MerR regulator